MPISSNPSYAYKQTATSTAVKTGPGVLGKIFVSAATGTPTITVYNNTAASGDTIVATFTPVAGATYTFDAAFDVGCYVALGATTTCTIFYV